VGKHQRARAETRRALQRPGAGAGAQAVEDWLTCEEFFKLLKWIDGRPLLDVIESYRLALLTQFLDPVDGILRFNLLLAGRGKKNWKSADLVLAAFFCLLANDSVGGNEVLLVASDEGQAAEDLNLAKKLAEINAVLAERLLVREKAILRRDGKGRMRILPGRDVAGEHGKSYRALFIDEIHTQKTYDLLEALALDPTRADAQMFITSYASLYHKPGHPLYDLLAIGKAGTDPKMLLSWYASDFCTDHSLSERTAEERANPSMATWPEGLAYLQQQQRRLPGHKYRRLHLNLGGLPEGAAYTVEMVLDAIERAVTRRAPQPGVAYVAFCDMSGGSRDDACLAIAHLDARGRAILDRLVNQGPPPPFDPRQAVRRFAGLMDEYGITHVWGDRLGGQTFIFDFAQYNKVLNVSQATTSQIYEALEPRLNAREIVLLDAPTLEQQLLGLIWRGQKIDHPNGEHDDWSCAAAGALLLACEPAEDYTPTPAEQRTLDGFRRWTDAPISEEVIDTESVDPYQHESMVWRRDGHPLW
jgi:hypothetical protein